MDNSKYMLCLVGVLAAAFVAPAYLGMPGQRQAAVKAAEPQIAQAAEERVVSVFIEYARGERRTDAVNEYQPVTAKVVGCVTRIRAMARLEKSVRAGSVRAKLRSEIESEAITCSPLLYEAGERGMFYLYIAALHSAGYDDPQAVVGPEFMIELSKAK